MDEYLVEININYPLNPKLHTLLIIFTLPPQTPILLYKWGFERVSFKRSCFRDDDITVHKFEPLWHNQYDTKPQCNVSTVHVPEHYVNL